jgi:hypothetical protein
MATTSTPMRELIEGRLDGPLADFVAAHRSSGTAWRRIAMEVWRTTGVDVSSETLRTWFGTDERVSA